MAFRAWIHKEKSGLAIWMDRHREHWIWAWRRWTCLGLLLFRNSPWAKLREMTKLNVEFLQWKSQMLPMILCFKIKNYKLLKYLNKVLKTKMENVCFILFCFARRDLYNHLHIFLCIYIELNIWIFTIVLTFFFVFALARHSLWRSPDNLLDHSRMTFFPFLAPHYL